MKCSYCLRPARWVSNKVVYGKPIGKSHMIWWCARCDAYVGCHLNTKVPKGTMANANLRRWRIMAHTAVDPFWQDGRYTRREVYAELKRILNYSRAVHIGESNEDECIRIIEAVKFL